MSRPTAAVAAELARAAIPHRRDEPLARHTTLGVGGPVPLFVEPRSSDEARVAVAILGDADLPYRVLGAGSNLLAADSGLDFAVVATAGLAPLPTFDGVRISVGAGVFLPRLAREAARNGLTGLEFAIGVPGSVGGAIRMNAGAWGSDMARVVKSVAGIDRHSGELGEQALAPGFSYRRSGIGPETIVTTVVFSLANDDPGVILATIERLLDERRATQPTASRSAGCAFKNPPGDSAGRLVDQAGLKGLRHGDAVVSERHANFVLNRGGATARDVFTLIADVKARVRDKVGVELEEEIVMWRGES